jgi:hypothetical protein
MPVIWYQLNKSDNCGRMAPQALIGGGYSNASLPAGMGNESGLYVIFNGHTGNVYCGIAQNMSNRFQTRLETITEMDIGANVMNQIAVVWGKVYVSARQQDINQRPSREVAPGANSITTKIGWMSIDLERLLIRVVASHVSGVQTLSNNVKISLYKNTSGQNITVMLEMAAVGGVVNREDFSVGWANGNDM